MTMNKGLKALEELKFQVGNITYFTRDLQITTFKVRDSGLFEIIEKELKDKEKLEKAFNIIKNKQANIKNLIEYCYNVALSYEEYVDHFNYSDNYFDLGKELLTEEEYDLLEGELS